MHLYFDFQINKILVSRKLQSPIFPVLSDVAFKPVFTEEVQIAIPIMKPTLDKVQLAGQALPPGFPAPFLFADGLSSVETLLTNIQVNSSLQGHVVS